MTHFGYQFLANINCTGLTVLCPLVGSPRKTTSTRVVLRGEPNANGNVYSRCVTEVNSQDVIDLYSNHINNCDRTAR